MTRSLPRSTSLLCLPLVLSAVTSAQDFAPFNADSHKLFATADHARTYSLAFDTAIVSGDTTTYFNFRTVRDTMLPSNCSWWGGAQCLPMDLPTWAGHRIDAASDGAHTFFNRWGGALNLPFHTDPLDTMEMYVDDTQRFLLSYDGEQSATVLGTIEQTRHYTILHRDLANNPINSALNGAPIMVGENIGLNDFFRVDSFPQVLVPLELVGQAEPPLGLYEITPAMLQDHQPGDETQFHETYFLQNGPPWNNYDRYRKYIYLSREDTPDAVHYNVRQELFNAGDVEVVVDTIDLSYDRATIIGSLPFERFDGTQPELTMVYHCGLGLWTYTTYPNQGLAYCVEENCWGPYDTNGPPPMGEDAEVVGLGQFHYWSYIIGPNGYSRQNDIVYFEKNGTECFQEVMMGTPGATVRPPNFQLSPNPSDGMMTISSGTAVASAQVIDLQGQTVTNVVLDARRGKLDMRSVAQGLYLVRLRFVDGGVGTQRVLIGR